ncbi:hypothetical protein ABZP36_015348 [Zizania latifolia]
MADPPSSPLSSSHSSTSEPPPSAPPAPPPPPRPACAACKFQRRKCKPGCEFAPFFPPEQPYRFRNAHRLFGVKHILRFMDRAGPEKLRDAMKSIIYEADAWAVDPVRGAYGVQLALADELRRSYAELAALQHQLALCQQQRQAQPPPPPPPAAPEGLGFHPGPPQPWMPASMIPKEETADAQQDVNYVYAAAPYAVNTVEDYVLAQPSAVHAAAAAASSTTERHDRESRRAPAALPSAGNGEGKMQSSSFNSNKSPHGRVSEF